jgi:predicted kinase
VCGLPGAGKTTFARKLENMCGAVRFCPDEWLADLGLEVYDEPRRARIEALQWKMAQRWLALGVSAVIEWGTWAREERETLREGARAMGAAVELHLVKAPLKVLYERVSRRGMENPPIRREDLELWAAKFETPTPDELALYDAPLKRR